MGTTQPIRKKEDIQRLKEYFLNKQQIRNYALVTLALNTSLRISDLLHLQWEDVYDFHKNDYRCHLEIIEQKTKKYNRIAINRECKTALNILSLRCQNRCEEGAYIFLSRKGRNVPIGRTCAFRIIANAAKDLKLEGRISCHSMRKTFGYHAWKDGVPPALIMAVYNHSSLEITKRYLSIDQDDKDWLFCHMNL